MRLKKFKLINMNKNEIGILLNNKLLIVINRNDKMVLISDKFIINVLLRFLNKLFDGYY